MRTHLDPKQVLFGLLRFNFGTGTFQRVKYLFVHFNGEEVSIVKRGRMNSRKGKAGDDVGSTHAEVKMTEVDECTLDGVLGQVAKSFITDDDISGGASSFSISKLKEDYNKMVKQAEKAKAEFDKRQASGPGLKRLTAAEMGAEFVSGEAALKSVREDLGAFNWALFKPHASHLRFLNAGSLSVNELRDWLKDDEVVFGIMRMGFGSGTFRRTKWLFLHWSGENIGAVKRGQANACKGSIHKLLSPVSVDFEATSLDEFTLETVINKVKRSVVVDGETKGGESNDPYTMENFMAALEEEAKKNSEFFGDGGELAGDSGEPKMSVDEIVNLVRDDSGPLTWALFTVKG